jgi:hypothetical protein
MVDRPVTDSPTLLYFYRTMKLFDILSLMRQLIFYVPHDSLPL